MTLLELSYEYSAHAEALSLRIRTLKEQVKTAETSEERWRLERRIAELRPLLQEARELSVFTHNYYDRGYHRNEKYTI